MKGAGTLALLLLLAAAAGVGLFLMRGERLATGNSGLSSERPARELYVEKIIGLPFKEKPVILPVSQDILLERIEESLDEQFGPSGLTRRTRAFDLLGLLPPGHNLRSELTAMEAGGVRGWFNPKDGAILVPGNFDEKEPYDQAVLYGLLTRLLLHQHTPLTIGRLSDDAWLARRGLHGAAAAGVETQLRKENPTGFSLPSSFETEREAILLALPMYVHNIAQFHLFQARDYLTAAIEADSRALGNLIAEPPESTLQLFGSDAREIKEPTLPPLDQTLLEESIGALGVQILFEWIDDFERSRELAALWRGDRYALFANGSGDHLLWICAWTGPEAAKQAQAILQRNADTARVDPISPRFRLAAQKGELSIYANCGDQETLDTLREALGIPDSPPAPAP